MASAASGDTITTAETIFNAADDGGPCRTFAIRCRSSGDALEVNIPGIHKSGEWFLVPADDTYHHFAGGFIETVQARSNDSSSTADYGVVVK